MRFVAGTPGANALIWNYHSRVRRPMMGSDNVDIDRGREIMGQFYGHLVEFYGVPYTFEDFLASNKYSAGFLEGLGLGANQAGMSYSDTDSAMRALASQSHGLVPANKTVFSDFLINQATTISNWQAIKYTVAQTAEDVSTGVQSVGQTAIETGKAANATAQLSAKLIQFAPIIGVGLIGYLIFSQVKRLHG